MTTLPSPRRSWGRIALIVALILSLGGNALALGAWLRFREARTELLGPDATTGRLPDELRAELRTALRANARDLAPRLRAVAEARAAITAAAKADPYNPAAAEAAMDGFRSAVDDLLIEVQVVFLEHLARRTED
jgi:uncharacterized membrane protein